MSISSEMQLATPERNGNGMAKHSTAASGAIAREAQEVQAAMFVAQQFPRDEIEAERRILQSCKRKGLAEQAVYAYPRGNETISGPSIRLAEVLAQNWGNMDTGIKELAQRNGESEVMAFAWDLQTNFRQVKVFTVKHERHTKQGKKPLTDPRDIYELVANQGSRRLRACILAVIPGDIVDAAVAECEKTMKGNNEGPIADRVKNMLAKFEALGVTKAQIEKRLNHKVDSIIEVELVGLRKIYKSLTDGFAKAEEFFGIEAAKTPAEKTDLEREILDEKPPKAPVETLAEGEIPNEPETVSVDTMAADIRDGIEAATTTAELDIIWKTCRTNRAALGEAFMIATKVTWDAKYRELSPAKK